MALTGTYMFVVNPRRYKILLMRCGERLQRSAIAIRGDRRGAAVVNAWHGSGGIPARLAFSAAAVYVPRGGSSRCLHREKDERLSPFSASSVVKQVVLRAPRVDPRRQVRQDAVDQLVEHVVPALGAARRGQARPHVHDRREQLVAVLKLKLDAGALAHTEQRLVPVALTALVERVVCRRVVRA